VPAPESEWLGRWRAAERVARDVIDSLLDADDVPFDARVARDVAATVPQGGSLLVASSMPVRDVEWFAAPRSGLRVHANRGANGIDGLVSTALGVGTSASGHPTVALLGDLAFLHDSNGLLVGADAADHGRPALTFVVLDNGGGGIFHFLPAGRTAEFEPVFATPQPVDLVAVAAAYGVDARRVERASEVGPALEAALAAGGVRVIVVPTDRHANVERHEKLWRSVAERLQ
jgi:2-succinyl-5-enolpyruvyl-6-hydroxy-3-cyclohexene-1-carboxylate synthase